MNKSYLTSTALIFSIIALGAGCNSTDAQQPVAAINQPAPSSAPLAPEVAAPPAQPAPEVAAAAAAAIKITPPAPKQPVVAKPKAQAVKEFNLAAKNWDWNPNKISVKKGDKVILHVTGADADHGFAIREYNINERFGPGETKTITFVADQAGSFSFYCSVPCGPGHRDMKGTLVVQE